MARYFCNKCRGRYRCTCASSAKQAFATETVNKVITVPKEGEQGEAGDKLVFKYQLSSQNITPPIIQQVPNPSGWSSTPLQTTEALPYRWVSQGYVNFDGTELVVNWSTPVVDLDTEPIAPESASDVFVR